MTAGEASDAAMRSIEHGVYSNLAFDVSSRGEELRKGTATSAQRMLDAVESFSPQRANALAEALRRNHTWFVPTLFSVSIQAALDSVSPDPLLNFIPDALRKQWAIGDKGAAATRQWWAKQYAADLRLTSVLHKAGVPILAGSDSLDRFVFPGSSLHEELFQLT